MVVNQKKTSVLKVDLPKRTSQLCVDYLSINVLNMFAKQGNSAMDRFHGPVTALTHSDAGFQSHHICHQVNTAACHLSLAGMGSPEKKRHKNRMNMMERNHKMRRRRGVETHNTTEKMPPPGGGVPEPFLSSGGLRVWSDPHHFLCEGMGQTEQLVPSS